MIRFFSDFQKGSSVEFSFYSTKVTLCYSDDRKKKSKTEWECLDIYSEYPQDNEYEKMTYQEHKEEYNASFIDKYNNKMVF